MLDGNAWPFFDEFYSLNYLPPWAVSWIGLRHDPFLIWSISSWLVSIDAYWKHEPAPLVQLIHFFKSLVEQGLFPPMNWFNLLMIMIILLKLL